MLAPGELYPAVRRWLQVVGAIRTLPPRVAPSTRDTTSRYNSARAAIPRPLDVRPCHPHSRRIRGLSAFSFFPLTCI